MNGCDMPPEGIGELQRQLEQLGFDSQQTDWEYQLRDDALAPLRELTLPDTPAGNVLASFPTLLAVHRKERPAGIIFVVWTSEESVTEAQREALIAFFPRPILLVRKRGEQFVATWLSAEHRDAPLAEAVESSELVKQWTLAARPL